MSPVVQSEGAGLETFTMTVNSDGKCLAMTLTLPAGPVGKMLAIASGLLALAILYLVVIAPLLGLYQSQTQELQLRAERAEYLRHAADTLPQLKEAAGRLALRNKSSGGLLLAEPSDAFAAATIQSTVKAMVTEDGGNLASVDTMQVQSVKGMRRGRYPRLVLGIAFSTCRRPKKNRGITSGAFYRQF